MMVGSKEIAVVWLLFEKLGFFVLDLEFSYFYVFLSG